MACPSINTNFLRFVSEVRSILEASVERASDSCSLMFFVVIFFFLMYKKGRFRGTPPRSRQGGSPPAPPFMLIHGSCLLNHLPINIDSRLMAPLEDVRSPG